MKPLFTIASSASRPRILLACEHASDALPVGISAPNPSPWAEHRASDVGAARLTRALASVLGAPAVLAGFSRLWVDANRDPLDPELIERSVDGILVPFNADVNEQERVRRLEGWHAPYHDRIDAEIAAHPSLTVLVSIHSFTRTLGAEERPYHFGILHDGRYEIAERLRCYLSTHAGEARDNQPYSGFEGKIYSIARHGQESGLPYLEIEVRDDLVGPDTAGRIADGLRSVMPPD